MANYKISGVWKDLNGEITHYAFHLIGNESIGRGVKTSKAKAIEILENTSNSAITWVWKYTLSCFVDGETVTVVNGSTGKYLRSNRDNTTTDNLAHLVDYDWLNFN